MTRYRDAIDRLPTPIWALVILAHGLALPAIGLAVLLAVAS